MCNLLTFQLDALVIPSSKVKQGAGCLCFIGMASWVCAPIQFSAEVEALAPPWLALARLASLTMADFQVSPLHTSLCSLTCVFRCLCISPTCTLPHWCVVNGGLVPIWRQPLSCTCHRPSWSIQSHHSRMGWLPVAASHFPPGVLAPPLVVMLMFPV